MATFTSSVVLHSAPCARVSSVAVQPSLKSACSFLPSRRGLVSLSSQAQKSLSASTRVTRLQVRAGVAEITESDFTAKVLEAESPVLVDFCAKWCGPCRLIAPVMDWAAKEYAGRLQVYKIDVDACPKLVEQYKVYGLPSVVIFDKGQVVPGGHIEGALTSAKLKGILEATVPALK
ncbi:hypothetical protein CLOM_g22145 [Closterium sp. NIES-68]|nr:hypothetical protein CLOM_g22145 [Closterium sp. NIES-68]GJP74499.1 hypothetical protein CLOP_g5069 [Closterium sp. NIES-67]